MVFDVYSLDGEEVNLIINRSKKTGEVYKLEFRELKIPQNGMASLRFFPEQNPSFKIEIDNELDGIFDDYQLPNFLGSQ